MTEINAWYRVTRDCTHPRRSLAEVVELHADERLHVVHLEEGGDTGRLRGLHYAVLDAWEDANHWHKVWLEVIEIDGLLADGTLEIATWPDHDTQAPRVFPDAAYVTRIDDPESNGSLYRRNDGTWFFVEEWSDADVRHIANNLWSGDAGRAIQEVLARFGDRA